MPSRAKRPCHLLTVAGRVLNRARHRLVAQPRRSKITAARNAMRRSVFPAASHDCKVVRSSFVNATSAAFIAADYHI